MTSLVVWLDHNHASLFDITKEEATPVGIKRENHGQDHEQAYFRSVAQAIKAAQEVLLMGPGTAKSQFLHFLKERDALAAGRVVGVENCDHPTPAQIMATGRKFFHALHHLAGTEARHMR